MAKQDQKASQGPETGTKALKMRKLKKQKSTALRIGFWFWHFPKMLEQNQLDFRNLQNNRIILQISQNYFTNFAMRFLLKRHLQSVDLTLKLPKFL